MIFSKLIWPICSVILDPPSQHNFPKPISMTYDFFPNEDRIFPKLRICDRYMSIFLYTICTTSANAKPTQSVVYMHATSASIQNPGPIALMVFIHNQNLIEISLSWNSVLTFEVATNFYTCHDSTAVVACVKFCSDQNFFKGEWGQKFVTWNLNLDEKKSWVRAAPLPHVSAARLQKS